MKALFVLATSPAPRESALLQRDHQDGRRTLVPIAQVTLHAACGLVGEGRQLPSSWGHHWQMTAARNSLGKMVELDWTVPLCELLQPWPRSCWRLQLQQSRWHRFQSAQPIQTFSCIVLVLAMTRVTHQSQWASNLPHGLTTDGNIGIKRKNIDKYTCRALPHRIHGKNTTADTGATSCPASSA